MIDRLFSALLTFCILAGGTVAIGSAMLDFDAQAAQRKSATAQPQVVQLPPVEVNVQSRLLARSDRNEARAGSLQ
jgi:hypothetical protein